MREKTIWVSLAENDERGERTKQVTRCSFDQIELETKHLSGIAIDSNCGGFQLYGFTFLAYESRSWYGNMAWNGYRIHIKKAVVLLDLLIRSGDWSVMDGPSSLHKPLKNKKGYHQ